MFNAITGKIEQGLNCLHSGFHSCKDDGARLARHFGLCVNCEALLLHYSRRAIAITASKLGGEGIRDQFPSSASGDGKLVMNSRFKETLIKSIIPTSKQPMNVYLMSECEHAISPPSILLVIGHHQTPVTYIRITISHSTITPLYYRTQGNSCVKFITLGAEEHSVSGSNWLLGMTIVKAS